MIDQREAKQLVPTVQHRLYGSEADECSEMETNDEKTLWIETNYNGTIFFLCLEARWLGYLDFTALGVGI